jgi:hypothetical protein
MINNQDWNKYVNTGEVELRVLQGIVKVIKTGGSLNGRQLAIYMSNSDIIETLLKLK